jgi:hypothetical protein
MIPTKFRFIWPSGFRGEDSKKSANQKQELPVALVGSIYGMSSMKIAHFFPIGQQTWPPHAILVSDWSISKKSSPLKLLSHMNRNLEGSIYMYRRFCIKFPQSRMKGERHRLSPLSL